MCPGLHSALLGPLLLVLVLYYFKHDCGSLCLFRALSLFLLADRVFLTSEIS